MSSKLETLLDFDSKVLADVGVVDCDGGGMLSYLHGDKFKPVTIDGKRLVLPFKQFLRDGDWTKRIAWHPLAEQINEGPSPILNATKNYITERLSGTFREIALSLMALAAEPKRHKALSAKAAKFLKPLVEADQKTVDTLRKVLDQVTPAPEKRSVSLFLQNGAKTGALRTCNVSFPILDEAENDDTKTFFGVKMPRTTKDKELIVAVFEYILGDKDLRDTYTKVSNNTDAPYLHCLLLSFHALAERFNNLITLHAPACPELKKQEFGLEWTSYLDDFENFSKTYGVAVPSLPGNSGVDADEVMKTEKSSVFESAAEDVAGKADLDLPWDDRPEDTSRRSSVRTEAPARESRSAEGTPVRSLKDILGGGRRRDEEENERSGRSSWRSRDSDRDRGRSRSRSGGGW